MKLHLTINGRWTDALEIEPERRRDAEYMENKKRFLQFRNQAKLDAAKAAAEFYLDPVIEETTVARLGALSK